MSATKPYLRSDLTWKGVVQALGYLLPSEIHCLKAYAYSSLLRFPIIDWDYAYKRSMYHSASACLVAMKAVILLYDPNSQKYQQFVMMMKSIVDEWAQLYE